MAALPYMQLYVAEYLADTQHLNGAQHGAYMLLMMTYWTRGKALPDSDERLAIIARTEIGEWREKVRPALEEFFTVAGGSWSHKRIEADLEAVNTKCGQAKANRLKRKPERETTPVPTDVPTPVLTAVPTDDLPLRREEKRREESKETPFQPTVTDQANLASRKVMSEAPLSGMRLQMAIEQTARHEITNGVDPLVVADAMLDAWREFKAARPRLEYPWGAEKFFGEGYWKTPEGWPWKPGQAPKPTGKPTRTALDVIREQEAADART